MSNDHTQNRLFKRDGKTRHSSGHEVTNPVSSTIASAREIDHNKLAIHAHTIYGTSLRMMCIPQYPTNITHQILHNLQIISVFPKTNPHALDIWEGGGCIMGPGILDLFRLPDLRFLIFVEPNFRFLIYMRGFRSFSQLLLHILATNTLLSVKLHFTCSHQVWKQGKTYVR